MTGRARREPLVGSLVGRRRLSAGRRRRQFRRLGGQSAGQLARALLAEAVAAAAVVAEAADHEHALAGTDRVSDLSGDAGAVSARVAGAGHIGELDVVAAVVLTAILGDREPARVEEAAEHHRP